MTSDLHEISQAFYETLRDRRAVWMEDRLDGIPFHTEQEYVAFLRFMNGIAPKIAASNYPVRHVDESGYSLDMPGTTIEEIDRLFYEALENTRKL